MEMWAARVGKQWGLWSESCLLSVLPVLGGEGLEEK